MLVPSGHFDQQRGVPIDLYLFAIVNDEKPRLIKQALNQDEIGWSGLNYVSLVHDIRNGLLYMESERPEGQRGEVTRQRSVMNRNGGKTHALPSGGEWFPLNDCKLLRHDKDAWTVYRTVHPDFR